MNKERFGIFIAENRKQRGLTQAQLADRLHVTDKAVSKWERGLSYPDVTLLEPLAGIFGISIDTLLRCQSLEDDREERKMEEQNESIQNVVEISRENQKGERRQWLKAVVVMAVTLVLFVILYAVQNHQINKNNPYYGHELMLASIELTEHTEQGDYIYVYDPGTPQLMRLRCTDGIDIDQLKTGWHCKDGVLYRVMYLMDYDYLSSDEKILCTCEEQPRYETVVGFGDFNEVDMCQTEKPLFGSDAYEGCDHNEGILFYGTPTVQQPGLWPVLLSLPFDGAQSYSYQIDDANGDGINEMMVHISREYKPYVLYDINDSGDIVTSWYDEAPEWADLLPVQ